MFVRTARGARRVSGATYKLLLTAHIIVSVGWLGVTVAKLALGLSAALASAPVTAGSLYPAIGVVDRLFPPAAVATAVTGILLSLGTKWGLFSYYWVVTKMVLTVATPITAVQIGDRLLRASAAATAAPQLGAASSDSTLLGLASAPTLLVALAVIHALMLLAATILSVYKPWGRTSFARRGADAAT